MCAIEEEKPIQLLIEEEPRFSPFDAAAWDGSKSRAVRQVTAETNLAVSMDQNCPWQLSLGDTALAEKIARMIDDHLPTAVTYRRRDFEQDSMMRELCRRNGLLIPSPRQVSAVRVAMAVAAVRVYVICDSLSAAEMLRELRLALERTGQVAFTQDPAELESAGRVLLLLTAGVLGGEALARLEQTIAHDQSRQQDRIVAVYSQEAGWSFGCEEQKQASDAVQQCLNDHEAICYRAPDGESGAKCHEFPAMVCQLMKKLGAGGDEVVSSDVVSVQPVAGVRDRLLKAERRAVAAESKLAVALARVRELEESKYSKVEEGIPPT